MPLTPLLGQLRRFVLERQTDATGVSGTGVVAAGVQLPSGKCVMEWAPNKRGRRGLASHASADDLIEVHGHNGQTVLRWLDGAPDA